MRKIRFVFPIIILTAIISATLGYFVGYGRVTQNRYHSDAMKNGLVLLEQSDMLIRNIDSSGVNVKGLIDTIEKNGDMRAKMVRTWLPHAKAEDKKGFSKALEKWETAKKKIEELGSSRLDN